MNPRNPIDACLENLQKLDLRLISVSFSRKTTAVNVRVLIKQAQQEVALLEAVLKDHPGLIRTQVALLEAAVSASMHKTEDAIQIAQTSLHAFLEDMGYLPEQTFPEDTNNATGQT